MKFEEEFPSLDIHEEKGKDRYYFNVAFIDDVQKHCLDKQRVRDAIKRTTYCVLGTIDPKNLLEKLGLDK